MNTHDNLVGRLAKLQNIVSKPELNDIYVTVLAYHSEMERFSVETLPPPNSQHTAAKILVKACSLAMCSFDHFLGKHPNATEVEVVTWETHSPRNGCILRLTTLQPKRFHLFFKYSQRVLGIKASVSNNSYVHPLTTLCGSTNVTPENEDAAIEFEDISFVGDGAATGYVACTNGRFTTFRRCSFRNVQVIVAGNDVFTKILLTKGYSENTYNFGTPNVVFENCVFDYEIYREGLSGLQVRTGGTALLLNCVIRNSMHGVLVTKGGQASLVHCTISKCYSGVRVEETVRLNIFNCSISENSGSGIMLSQSEDAAISGSKITHCAYGGVVVKGSKHINRVLIENCYISDCLFGALIEMGKIVATIKTTTVLNSKSFGVAVFSSVMGNVEVNNCRIADNGDGDVASASDGQCVVTVDGAEQEIVFDDNHRSKYLYARRSYQQAGLCDITCLNCGKIEETGVKFKKCGKCEGVVYCSRKCQKAHWKEHKTNCKPSNLSLALAAAAQREN